MMILDNKSSDKKIFVILVTYCDLFNLLSLIVIIIISTIMNDQQ